ncbi:hypothetical protein R3I94_010518 [Phoxinus phoxinus]
MQILTMMMIMMMMSFMYSAVADQSLECYNDFHNSFTCVWNASALNIGPETGCEIRVTVRKAKGKPPVKTAPMLADPTRTHTRSATVDFQIPNGVIISQAWLQEEVRCGNSSQPVATIAEHKAFYSVVKVAAPQNVEVRGLNASWTVSFKYPLKTFEVQCRPAAQSWTDEQIRPAPAETHLTLSEDELFLQQQFVIRVRVKPSKLPNAIWSDWSQEYSWTSEVGQTPPTPGLPLSTGTRPYPDLGQDQRQDTTTPLT